jgi:hypothetical protein
LIRVLYTRNIETPPCILVREENSNDAVLVTSPKKQAIFIPRLSLPRGKGRARLHFCDVVHTPRTHSSVLILGIGIRWASEKSTVKLFDAGFDVGREVARDASTRKLAMTSFA